MLWWLVVLASVPPPALPCERPVDVSGVVLDPAGAPVGDARVQVVGAGWTVRVRTDAAGSFATGACPGRVTLVATRAGFADGIARAEIGGTRLLIRVVLGAAVASERVSVASAGPMDGTLTPGAVTSIDNTTDDAAGSRPLDDVLRRVPGFSLLRLSSSRVANPTTQGVSMRGFSASGASRAVVLADGLPLNDPFGGWVYWDRIPDAAVARLDVARGGASERFGSSAVGGVVDIVTRDVRRSVLRASVSAADSGQASGSMYLARSAGRWSFAGAAQVSSVPGYYVLSPGDRGPVDRPAGGRAASALGLASLAGGTERTWQVDARVNVFGESRWNGTPQQENSTSLAEGAWAFRKSTGRQGWEARVSVSGQRFGQTFSAVAPDRASERPTGEQRIPARSAYASAGWNWTSSRARTSAGLEVHDVRANGTESSVDRDGHGTMRALGGRTGLGAAFVRGEVFAARTWTAMLGVRADQWLVWSVSGERSGDVARRFSPRASLTWQTHAPFVFQVSAYGGFRAPTLNELFRGFSVGNIVTRANANLGPERLTGAELGVVWSRPGMSVRGTVFSHALRGAVTNVTLSSTPTATIRERQNAGSIRAGGAEVEGDVRPAERLRVRFSLAITRSRVRAARVPALDGRLTPQVPLVQGGAGLLVDLPARLRLDAAVRHTGPRFEDDRNLLPLGAATIVDLTVARAVTPSVSFFAAVENLANRQYDVGRTPLRLVGLPRVVHAGIRLEIGRAGRERTGGNR